MLALLAAGRLRAPSRRLLPGREVLGGDRRRRLLRGGGRKPQHGRLVEGCIAGHVPASELEQRDDVLVERCLGRQVDLNGACGHGGPISLRILRVSGGSLPTAGGSHRDMAVAGYGLPAGPLWRHQGDIPRLPAHSYPQLGSTTITWKSALILG